MQIEALVLEALVLEAKNLFRQNDGKNLNRLEEFLNKHQQILNFESGNLWITMDYIARTKKLDQSEKCNIMRCIHDKCEVSGNESQFKICLGGREVEFKKKYNCFCKKNTVIKPIIVNGFFNGVKNTIGDFPVSYKKNLPIDLRNLCCSFFHMTYKQTTNAPLQLNHQEEDSSISLSA